MTKIIELIATSRMKGTGKNDNPYRECRQLYTKDGILVAEQDPLNSNENFIDLKIDI